MYFPPKAELLLAESEEIMALNFPWASAEKDETDNTTEIDTLLSGLL